MYTKFAAITCSGMLQILLGDSSHPQTLLPQREVMRGKHEPRNYSTIFSRILPLDIPFANKSRCISVLGGLLTHQTPDASALGKQRLTLHRL